MPRDRKVENRWFREIESRLVAFLNGAHREGVTSEDKEKESITPCSIALFFNVKLIMCVCVFLVNIHIYIENTQKSFLNDYIISTNLG